jgi:hypothetical protein
MESKKESNLEHVLKLFFYAEHGLDITDVKEYLDNLDFTERKVIFKYELANAILTQSISINRFEQLTGIDYETQKEVDEFLIEQIWKPLYGDEPVKI